MREDKKPSDNLLRLLPHLFTGIVTRIVIDWIPTGRGPQLSNEKENARDENNLQEPMPHSISAVYQSIRLAWR